MPVQTEWLEKNCYEVLGVPESTSDKEIQRAYRRLARQFHPDANPGNPQAEERFKEISAAYDVIGDADKRKEYDELRRLGPMAAAGGGGFAGFRLEDLGGLGDLGDLFGDLFGGRARSRGGRRGGGRGRDLETELHLDFEQAVFGLTTEIHLTSEAPCDTCGGSGGRPGTTPATCGTCDGRGVVAESQGFFSTSQPCPRCGGRGQIVEDPCGDCAGRGTRPKPRTVRVRLPAGVDDRSEERV